MNKLSSGRIPLVPIVLFAFALALRLSGIAWGLPDAGRAFSWHPDETVVVSASLRTNPLLLLLDPGFYNYGSLSLLINGFFIHLGDSMGLISGNVFTGAPSAGDLLTARLVTASLGAGTCLFLYGAGRLLYSETAGLAAALLYAVSPLAVQHGHFATVDVPATFFVAGTLYFAARYLRNPVTDARSLLLCGLFAGFSAATKYNAGLILFSGLTAWGVAERNRTLKSSMALIGMAALGFFLGCPGVLLNFPAFLRDFLFEANHARTGSGDLFVGTASGFIYHPFFTLPWAVGSLTALAILSSLLMAVYRRNSADYVLAAFMIPYFIVIGLAEIKFARYLLPLLPALLLWVGALIPLPENRRWYRVMSAAIGLCGLYALFISLAFNNVMMEEDTRDTAAKAIRKEQKEGKISSVGFATGPWHYSPNLQPFLAIPIPVRAKEAALSLQNLRLIPADGEWNVSQLKTENADAIGLSEFEYGHLQSRRTSEFTLYISELKSRYPRRLEFLKPLHFAGISLTGFYKQHEALDLPAQYPSLPHDMLYTNPTTLVFVK